MSDIVSAEKRSKMMAGIKGTNTRPEILVRKLLHAEGFRFRLHNRHLPGKPDITLKKHKTVILVHGCFWHVHDCYLFKYPSTRQEFWKTKLERNRSRDIKNQEHLINQGWRVLIVWECAMKGKKRLSSKELKQEMTRFIHGNQLFYQLKGKE